MAYFRVKTGDSGGTSEEKFEIINLTGISASSSKTATFKKAISELFIVWTNTSGTRVAQTYWTSAAGTTQLVNGTSYTCPSASNYRINATNKTTSFTVQAPGTNAPYTAKMVGIYK